ncbi:MAG: hypothetical protein AB2652_04805 [Candidatus Thiodiazotropha endolucinida]
MNKENDKQRVSRRVGELSEQEIKQLEQTEVSPEHDHLDAELENAEGEESANSTKRTKWLPGSTDREQSEAAKGLKKQPMICIFVEMGLSMSHF